MVQLNEAIEPGRAAGLIGGILHPRRVKEVDGSKEPRGQGES